MTQRRNDEAPGIVLPDCLDVAARNSPDELALAYEGAEWTYRELATSVTNVANWLRTIRDDSPARIGILAANGPGFVFVVHAARQLGASAVPLNWRQTAEELAWQIADSGISVLVVDIAFRDRGVAAVGNLPVAIVSTADIEAAAIAEAEGCHSSPVSCRACEESRRSPATSNGSEDSSFVGTTPSQGTAENTQPRAIPADQEVAVVYTSGTSGRPKGARLTYGNVWFSAVSSALHLGHHHDDGWLAVLPLFHVGGLSILFRAAIGGVPVHLHHSFDPLRALTTIDDGASLVSLVPTLMARLLEARGDAPWPDTLRCILLGGSSTPTQLVEDCHSRGVPVAPTYGLTEAASQVTTLLPRETSARPGSSGRPLPLSRVRVARDGELASEGAIGEIEVSGPTVFPGYLGQDAAEAEFGEPGWFATGDMGYFDDDGYLYVVDRRDDLIVSGGENVYPAEIERVVLEHPNVRDAGVVGVPDEEWGARPLAAVVWTADEDSASEALAVYCRARLAPYKVPVGFVLLRELPRSASGKLLRQRLRELITASRN